jgi:hypothetical protein
LSRGTVGPGFSISREGRKGRAGKSFFKVVVISGVGAFALTPENYGKIIIWFIW